MREIKFRGRAYDGHWCYGSLVMRDGNPSISSNNSEWGVEPETVGQLTGLKDNNGVEIYEGDVVNCHIFVQELGENYGVVEGEREFIGKVSFDVTGFNVEANGFRDNPVFYEEFHEESLEVIGNIYENPELLTVELDDGQKVKISTELKGKKE
jgi:hypothetical protein